MALVLAGCVVLAMSLVATGCTDSAQADPTPVRTFKITPAAARTVVAGVASPSVMAAPRAAAGGGIDIVGRDTKFDVTDLSAAAGAVTIRFDNRDSGIVHNLH